MSDALAHLLVAVIAVFTALCSIVLISGGSDSRFIQSGIPSSPSPLTFPATSANFPSAMFDPPGSPWDGPELSQSPQPSGGCPLRLPETTPAAEVYALMVLPQPPAPRLVPFRHKILSLAAFFLLAVVAAINKPVHVQDFGRVCKRSLHSTIRRWSSVVSRCWVVGEIHLRKELPEWPRRLAGAIILDVSMLSLSCALEHFRTVSVFRSIGLAVLVTSPLWILRYVLASIQHTYQSYAHIQASKLHSLHAFILVQEKEISKLNEFGVEAANTVLTLRTHEAELQTELIKKDEAISLLKIQVRQLRQSTSILEDQVCLAKEASQPLRATICEQSSQLDKNESSIAQLQIQIQTLRQSSSVIESRVRLAEEATQRALAASHEQTLETKMRDATIARLERSSAIMQGAFSEVQQRLDDSIAREQDLVLARDCEARKAVKEHNIGIRAVQEIAQLQVQFVEIKAANEQQSRTHTLETQLKDKTIIELERSLGELENAHSVQQQCLTDSLAREDDLRNALEVALADAADARVTCEKHAEDNSRLQDQISELGHNFETCLQSLEASLAEVSSAANDELAKVVSELDQVVSRRNQLLHRVSEQDEALGAAHDELEESQATVDGVYVELNARELDIGQLMTTLLEEREANKAQFLEAQKELRTTRDKYESALRDSVYRQICTWKLETKVEDLERMLEDARLEAKAGARLQDAKRLSQIQDMEEKVEGLRNAISEMTQQVDALEAEVEEANGAVVQKDRQMQTRETHWQTMLDGLDASRTGLEAQFTARTLEQNLNIRDLRSELEQTKDQLAAEKKLTAQLKKRKCTTKHDAELSTKPANCDQNDTCAYISTDLTGSVPAQIPSNCSRALGFSDLNLSPRANGAALSTWPSSPSPLAVTHKDKGSPVIVATAPSDHDLFNSTLTVPPQVQATITPRQLARLGWKTLTSESEEQCVSPLEEAGPILDSIQSPSCPIDLALPKIVDWSLPQGSPTSHGGSANSSRRHSAVSTFSTSAFQLDMAVPLSSIKTETLEEPLSPSACLWIACPSEREPRPSTSPRDIADLFSPLLNGSDSSAFVPPLFATLDVPLASPSNVVRDETNVLPSPTSNRVTGGGDVPPAEIIVDSVVGLPPWVQFEQRIDARCRTSTPAGRSPSEPSCPLPTPTKTQTSTRTPLGALDNTARDNDGRVSRAGFR